jgi:hypothetical protein
MSVTVGKYSKDDGALNRMTVGTLNATQRLALLLAFHAQASATEAADELEQREVWMGLRPPPGWVELEALLPGGSHKEALETVRTLQCAGYVTARARGPVMIYRLTEAGREAGEMIDADPALSALAEPCSASPAQLHIEEAEWDEERGEAR